MRRVIISCIWIRILGGESDGFSSLFDFGRGLLMFGRYECPAHYVRSFPALS